MVHEIIEQEIELLKGWVKESLTGGWSTHLVKPMEERINYLTHLLQEPAPLSVGNEKTAGQIINRILRENDARFTDFEMELVEIMMKEYADQFRSAPSIQFEKNFVVRLKALFDKKMREHGIFDLMRNSSEHYDDYNRKKSAFFDSFTDGDYNQLLKCFKASAPSIPSREEAEGEAKKRRSEFKKVTIAGIFFYRGFMAAYDWLLSQIGQPGYWWTKEKPKDDGEKLIFTATYFDGWNFASFTITWNGDYYAICDIDGKEWGPYEDLTADLYYVIPSPPKQ